MPSHATDRSELAECCARAVDAHTLEDAIYWHSEILDLLALEMLAVHAKPWTNAMKIIAIAAFRSRAEYHRDIVDRLTDILENDNEFIWRHTARES